MKHITIIASYPRKDETHGTGVVGVASYTKELLIALKATDPNSQVTVFSEQFNGTEKYSEKGIKIFRSWKRNNPLSILKAFYNILKSPTESVLTSFEINMFGNVLSTSTALLGLIALRLSGKRTFTIMHQVVKDFNSLEQNALKRTFLDLAKNLLYLIISLGSTNIIVFEEALKEYLGSNISKKTVVIPHAIFSPKKVSKEKARKYLGLNKNKTYTLYFGFLAPYKGVDKLIASWPTSQSTELLIAGGENPNHTNNKKIQQYIKNLRTQAAKKGITITGFIPEEKIPYYYSASDVVILPYSSFISSSGPLALSIAYNLPFLLSPALNVYSKSADIKTSLDNASLSIHDLVCKLTPNDLKRKVIWAVKNAELYSLFAANIKSKRSFAKVSSTYMEVIK